MVEIRFFSIARAFARRVTVRTRMFAPVPMSLLNPFGNRTHIESHGCGENERMEFVVKF